MNPLKIAVVGSGISGLSAAWLLAKRHDVTLIEADDRLGGHTNTASVDIDGVMVDVDTGFICFNSATYPNLIALFEHLDIAVHETSMSFSASLAAGRYEYSGGTYTGMLAQPANALKREHWRMISDILRFFKEAPADLPALDDVETIDLYLSRKGYSPAFRDRHLIPMAAAIWSSGLGDMLDYPAKAFIRFFQNHGLLQVSGRPKWRTVLNGSQTYIDRILADGPIRVVTSSPIERIVRHDGGVVLHDGSGVARPFDQVVIAAHADQALAMLDAPSYDERQLLGSFRYSHNVAVLHRDRSLMPKRKLAWASWNYLDFRNSIRDQHLNENDLCLTYWMNSLQSLPTKENVFVTLNPPRDREIGDELLRCDYSHPIFDEAALRAQSRLWSLQGVNRTWFCGAHFGAGFHEDGLQSGLAVAEQLGGVRRPWRVENESGRICLDIAEPIAMAAE
ncbi:MAG: FAD-dependent oxidoreductase [Ahrensia sp.]|nr:FAD-dependent oxidoreductase [Ahrensia sp.]